MNPTYMAIEFKRQARDVSNLMFVVLLPAAMYLLFGAASDSGSTMAGYANVKFYVMISMAAYGAVTAVTGIAATAATEQMQGWGRQIGLTPMRPWQFVLSKTMVALAFAALAMVLVYAFGAFTGAEANETWMWWACAGISLACASVFALYGLAAGLLFKSESAAGVAAGFVTFFAFFGNVFMPLSGAMLDIARFTPMYGMIGLVRWPILEGYQTDGSQQELWVYLLNLGAWALIFLILSLWGVQRSRARR